VGSSLARWLAALDADRLAEILVRRPETVTNPPRNLSEFAGRLQTPDSVIVAFQGLPLPAVQLVEVLQSIGGPAVPPHRLAEALGRHADDPDVAATLRILTQRALVWSDPDSDGLRMAGPLWSAFPHPLRLGAPAERLLHPLPATRLREIAAALDVTAGRGRKETLRGVCRHLADAEAVRTLVEGAPEQVRKLLVETAWNGPLVAVRQPGNGYGRRSAPALEWAVDRGLLVPDGWQHAQMPAEVGRALRGPQWRPRFDPHPPEPALAIAEPAAVAREAAAAASTAVERVAALLDSCAATPVAVLKTGGVGVRELRRLAKSVGCGEPEVRLWLELAYGAGLVALVREEVLPTEAYDSWCAAEPAARLVPLLRAWLRLPAAPLAVKPSGDGPPPAALIRDPTGLSAFDLRPQVLDAAAGLPEGRGIMDPESVEAVLHWRAPVLIGAGPRNGELIGGLWREACLLGVVAHGALTPLGRALLGQALLGQALLGRSLLGRSLPGKAGGMDGGDDDKDDDRDLAEVAAELLPAALRTAMFQADLTAVVPGVPAADLAELLDCAADRESRGGAATWRFSPASVRRALDAGRDGTALLAELRGFATAAALPQPLEYLVGDVARRHGAIRVRSVGCVLHAEDPALLAEVASARALSALGLAVLAPTVLVSARPADETLAALRAAGYAPSGESADGTMRIEKAPRRRAPAQRRRRPPAHPLAGSRQPRAAAPADPRALAEALLAAQAAKMDGRPTPGDSGQLELALDALDDDLPDYDDPPDYGDDLPDEPMDEVDGPAASIVRYAGHLSGTEQARLLAAVEDGTAIEISYTNAQGHGSVRVVEPIDLDDHLLVAWCQLREEERAFALDRIHAVSPA
jgi:hypothetical protein